jgi:hypothetical protein
MDIPCEIVHEMFYTFHHGGSWFAAVAQVSDQAGIVCSQAAKLGNRHAGAFDELFDLAEQHWQWFLLRRASQRPVRRAAIPIG